MNDMAYDFKKHAKDKDEEIEPPLMSAPIDVTTVEPVKPAPVKADLSVMIHPERRNVQDAQVIDAHPKASIRVHIDKKDKVRRYWNQDDMREPLAILSLVDGTWIKGPR